MRAAADRISAPQGPETPAIAEAVTELVSDIGRPRFNVDAPRRARCDFGQAILATIRGKALHCIRYKKDGHMARARYREIVQDMSERIRSGAIRPGERMPTHRDLAYTRGLSLGTATRVYAELVELGLVTGEVGRGTFARAPVAAKASAFYYDREASSVVDLSRNFHGSRRPVRASFLGSRQGP